MRKQKPADGGGLTELMQEAYNAIGALTPMKNSDCGGLCGKICCEGKDAGMLLFPGEEPVFRGLRGFAVKKIRYMGVPGAKLLLCDGVCDREMRPFACRMFPVAPKIDENGGVSVQPDIRGRQMCPIWDLKKTDKAFVEAVGNAFGILAKDEAAMALMRLISAEIAELKRFFI